MQTPNPNEQKYRMPRAFMWALGLLVIGGCVIKVLSTINRSIVAATQQQLAQLVLNSRFLMIYHPQLFDSDPVFAAFNQQGNDLPN